MNILKMSRVDERTGGCLLPVRFQSALNSSLTQRRPFCGRRDVLPVSILREGCCQPRENLFRQPSLTAHAIHDLDLARAAGDRPKKGFEPMRT